MARRHRHRRLKTNAVPDGLVLDAGAVTAAGQGDAHVRAELALAEQLGVPVLISTVTLAEVLRGHARDSRLHALLKGVEQRPVTAAVGRAAGELLGRTGRADTIDAIVAVTADSVGGRVHLLTGDPADLATLTHEMPRVAVVRI